MKNLIAELLVKLAQKEEESKELVAQVEALEIVVTALLRQMAKPEQEARWKKLALIHRFPQRMRSCFSNT